MTRLCKENSMKERRNNNNNNNNNNQREMGNSTETEQVL